VSAPPDIAAALQAVVREDGAAVILAVESGSRAWGFPSPDSDWDVRVLYARPSRWYLGLTQRPEVIERMLPGDLDISGWDARKAILLLLSGNAVLREWLVSPIRYAEEPALLAGFRALAALVPARPAAAHHYRSLGRKTWDRYLRDAADVPLKKYFYALRPALALHWMAQNPAGDPPMDLPGLLAGTEIPPATRACIDGLVAAKSVASEMGRGGRVAVLDALILDALDAPAPPPAPTPDPAWMTAAETLFQATLDHADQVVPHAG